MTYQLRGLTCDQHHVSALQRHALPSGNGHQALQASLLYYKCNALLLYETSNMRRQHQACVQCIETVSMLCPQGGSSTVFKLRAAFGGLMA